MNHIYLGAVAFGFTLLVASLVLGGKDTDHGGHSHDDGDSAASLAWAPIASLRFWVFMFAFGGAAGLALDWLGSGDVVSMVGALGVGWVSGSIAVSVIRALSKRSVSSELTTAELVGTSATVVLPIAPDKPGKVRVEIKGRAEDFVAHVDDGPSLPSGTSVLVVAERDHGALLVARHEM